MATAISSRVRRKRRVAVKIAMAGIRGKRTNVAVEISWIRRWPAVRFAVSRTPRARGRIKRLIVSIIMRIGIRSAGVPSGSRWPKAWVGWFRMPVTTAASQSGTAKPRLRESCVVGVKVYGRRPSKFRVIKKIISEVNRVAHLCPPEFMGRRSCWVKRLMKWAWRDSSRLFSHRVVGAGYKSMGRIRARLINGTPKCVGLINWSNMFNVMVNFRVL